MFVKNATETVTLFNVSSTVSLLIFYCLVNVSIIILCQLNILQSDGIALRIVEINQTE